jgi:hypothetical protein
LLWLLGIPLHLAADLAIRRAALAHPHSEKIVRD